MKQYSLKDLSESELQDLYRRPKMDFNAAFAQVEPIIEQVKSSGNVAISKFTRKFDGVDPDPLVVNPQEFSPQLNPEVKQAIDTAFDNILRFHKAQLSNSLEVETMPGVRCMRESRPIPRVGLYVPGGSALLPSTLMMLGIPALLAGCEEIIIATPPRTDDSVADEILYIAQKIGVSVLLKAGGAQAVAGMALGTETVPKADKIFGPGNQYVTAAKMLLQNSEAQIAIDMPAGPSEVLVIADGSATPHFVAADLLSQAEHGPDSQVVLVATGDFDVDSCHQSLRKQLSNLPRKKIASQAIEKSFTLTVETLEGAFTFSNAYAPEHLIVQVDEAETWKGLIQNAGSVFFGHWTPESAGDYASGTNHTLPTYGYARMFSGVSVDSFQKQITMQSITKEGLQNIGPTVEKLASLEKLDAHRRAVSIRLDDLNS